MRVDAVGGPGTGDPGRAYAAQDPAEASTASLVSASPQVAAGPDGLVCAVWNDTRTGKLDLFAATVRLPARPGS